MGSAEIAIPGKSVGDHPALHAGGEGSSHTPLCVLDRHALLRFNGETRSTLEIGVWVGFVTDVVPRRHNSLEK